MRSFLTFLLLIFASNAQALEFRFEEPATQLFEKQKQVWEFGFPKKSWNGRRVPMRYISGKLSISSYRFFELQSPKKVSYLLRKQLAVAGYKILFQCEDWTCGGFDFSPKAQLVEPPSMYIDLGDYHYTLARAGRAYVSILVSRAGKITYVQIASIRGQEKLTISGQKGDLKTLAFGIAAALNENGFAVLEDLVFKSASAVFKTGDESLAQLARYLADNRDRKVILVGHSDGLGSMEENITLSKKRAAAVATYLVTEMGVDRKQLQAEGIGPLSPHANNNTLRGRKKNRRVVAVLQARQKE